MENFYKEALATECSYDKENPFYASVELAGLMELLIETGHIADKYKKAVFYKNAETIPNTVENLYASATVSNYEERASSYKEAVNPRLLHAALGKLTEAVELLEALHTAGQAGTELDKVNFIEEVGDGMWYDGIILDELGVAEAVPQEAVMRKLRKVRYGNGFSAEAATKRDLKAERAALEGE